MQTLWIVLASVGIFSVVEFVVGSLSHSLALQADSGHMLSDFAALGVALLATWVTRQSGQSNAVQGDVPRHSQVEAIAALANGLGMLSMTGFITWEALRHLHHPPAEILSFPMLITAIIGLGINGFNAILLYEKSQQNLNLKGVFLHVVADTVSSVGTILAALMVWLLSWHWADSAIGLAVALFTVFSSVPLIRQSLKSLNQPAPNSTSDPETLRMLGFLEIGTVQLDAVILQKSPH
ncbi:MAG: cation diffusion facilitator family transporter [Microcoleaceae cyanobacterium]